ncbi:Fc.00g082250.m01.CDS01 [Cosmosporella sp. VM-42]
MEQSYKTVFAEEITDQMLEAAATLFTENYGTWGKRSKRTGKPVTLSAKRLRDQYLPANTDCRYTMATTSDDTLVGNAFTCRWDWDGKNVCWVTQLVVHKEYRGKGIATTLLRMSMANSDDVYGIMSSHPYACVAAAATFGSKLHLLAPANADLISKASIENVSLDFVRQNSAPIMKASPIAYVRDAVLRGTLFDAEDPIDLVCGVNTDFFVDHEEPLNALAHLRDFRPWRLGDLPDGHEFLLLFPTKPRW